MNSWTNKRLDGIFHSPRYDRMITRRRIACRLRVRHCHRDLTPGNRMRSRYADAKWKQKGWL